MPTPLSRDFTLEELTFSQTAARLGIRMCRMPLRSHGSRPCARVFRQLEEWSMRRSPLMTGLRCRPERSGIAIAGEDQHTGVCE